MFDTALAERVGELHDVKIRACLTMRPRAVLEADPDREHFHWFNWHLSGYDRAKCDAGCAELHPVQPRRDPRLLPAVHRSARDRGGQDLPDRRARLLQLQPRQPLARRHRERAKIVVVEESAGLPYVHGIENGLHESEVDYVIDGGGDAAPELPNPPPTDVDRAVAHLIAAEIEDGSCLQIGIGAMPNAVCSLLLESGVRNLGIHTEMLTDGIIDLYRAGVVTGARKNLHPGKVVCTFGLGSQTQYETADRNPDFLCQPVEMTNLPHIVMQNDRVASINNTTQMDLQGQAASESDGHRHISGTGGQSSSSAARTRRRAASRSSACRRPTSAAACARAASSST